MTELLQRAFDEASKLPAAEQDAFAVWLMEELESDRKWDRTFEKSAEMLERLAAEALLEHDAGLTRKLDPNEL